MRSSSVLAVTDSPETAAVPATPDVEIRRSARRRRTVSAYRDGPKTIVLVPERLSRSEERRWVATMLERLERREARRSPSDPDLRARALALSARYLDGRARPVSVRWSTTQNRRWGSCTAADGSIRLSTRLRGMPGWVLDYVIVHELAHLLVPDHSAAFWSLVEHYPRTERARGYLQGVSDAEALGVTDGEAPDSSDGAAPDYAAATDYAATDYAADPEADADSDALGGSDSAADRAADSAAGRE